MHPLRDLASHPKLQDLIKRAVNLRSDLLDRLDGRLGGVAKRLNLVTRHDMKLVKRQVRELENQVATLEHQLAQERLRADRAEKELTEALKTARKAAADAKAANEARAAAEAKAADAKAAAEATAAAEAKPAEAKKAPRSRKKVDTGGEAIADGPAPAEAAVEPAIERDEA